MTMRRHLVVLERTRFQRTERWFAIIDAIAIGFVLRGFF